jgi:hypothetical protein
MPDVAERLDWISLSSRFSIISGADVLRLERMERHQDLRERVRWLDAQGEPPLVLLFVSHRWETLAHPDPSGRQLAAVHALLRKVCVSVEAMLGSRDERLLLVPSLECEGDLQAAEIVRRLFGFGPFAGSAACVGGEKAKATVQAEYVRSGGDRIRFCDWLASRIGVWIDYICMPQEPLSSEEALCFKRTLRELDSLVAASTVVALRESDDDYAMRGWCATEFFLGSGRSFANGLFVDMHRLSGGQPVAIPSPPPGLGPESNAQQVMADAYSSELAAWREALQGWSSADGPLVLHWPPDTWARYRDLQGAAFPGSQADPNPFRCVLDAVSALETALVAKWLISDRPRAFDLGDAIGRMVAERGLRCAKAEDLVYVGLLAACNGWIDAFRPLLRECLRRHVAAMELSTRPVGNTASALVAKLLPPPEELGSLLSKAQPNSPATWASRLRYANPVGDSQERSAIAQVRACLDQQPLGFSFVATAEPLGELEVEQLV